MQYILKVLLPVTAAFCTAKYIFHSHVNTRRETPPPQQREDERPEGLAIFREQREERERRRRDSN